MVYNQHIIGTGRDKKFMAKFKYDPDTKTCYMPANTALYAFDYYNDLVKPPLLKDIPDPVRLAVDMEDSYGYVGGNISDKSSDRLVSPLIDLMYRQPAQDCQRL